MGDRHQAVASLVIAAETSKAALLALSTPGVLPPNDQHPSLEVLHKDLASLLSLVYSDSTKLSIALKPSKPTYSASVAVLKELSTHILALSANVNLFDEIKHGATLKAEATHVVRDVIEAVNGLLQTFLDLNADGRPATSGSGAAGEEYLVKTGTIHDLVERARGPNGISKDNRSAVRKRWAEDRSTLEDALKEVTEAIEDAEQEDSEDGGEKDEWEEENDAEWAEWGISATKMTKDELEQAKAIHPLLRVTTLLHKRILLDLLAPAAPALSSGGPTLDTLLSHSTSLQSAFDNLVAVTLYPSERKNGVLPAIDAFGAVLNNLNTTIDLLLPEQNLEGKMAALEVADGAVGKQGCKQNRDMRKWFDMCFQQVHKLADNARARASNTQPS
ncbi:hypothetical protein PUNSTDRAFT_144866 [Punctularia strigosozonata HHB-11173 SS5]|uniref:uncharacterized protein n=1 Tax=Punctularia strigosozonata (strain HHB-11173) TaxID=741275 RepID=UPI00044178A5|nr:uncharacterized protein PUNSTDRAFT_144866 [Punctularia strigosozonata HHB-11173 SS5]EIN07370.1 hypothetical protein PUNSTDRAFT_144866 [Punctularia strigosozonata HHB-11173 SS5]